MNEFLHLCMGCMNPTDESSVICPNCNYNSLSVQPSPYLPKESILLGKYMVGKLLYSTSDSAVYIGYDIIEKKTVKICEFLPQKLIIREIDEKEVTVRANCEKLYFECMGSFESIRKSLRDIKGSVAIDKITDFFFVNNTAYCIVEYHSSIPLSQYLQTRGSLLPWSKVVSAFKPIMSVLERLHKAGIVHGSISPETIHVGEDGKLKIEIFPIPQANGRLPEICEQPISGYAPIERYKNDCSLSFSTDVYSVMALIYTVATGFVPPPSTSRLTTDTLSLPPTFTESLNENTVDAFYQAMAVFPDNRLSSMQELSDILLQKKPSVSENENAADENITGTQDEEENKPKKAPLSFEEKEELKKKRAAKRHSIFTAVKGIATGIIVATMLFFTAYTTFLYQYIQLDTLNDILASFSFLPMNANNKSESVHETVPPQALPSQIVTTEPVQSVVVADFTRLNYEDIKQSTVFNENYYLVYEFEFSDEHPKNTIIRQSHVHGAVVEKGTTITLVVSKGKESVVLDDVIGLDYDDAHAILTADGFVVKKVILKNNGAQPVNEVFTMSHVAGLEFEKGTEITLSVWGQLPVSEESTSLAETTTSAE